MGGLIEYLPLISASLNKNFCRRHSFSNGSTFLYSCLSTNATAIIILSYTYVNAGALYMIQRSTSSEKFIVHEIFKKMNGPNPSINIREDGVAITTNDWSHAYILFFSEDNSNYTFSKV